MCWKHLPGVTESFDFSGNYQDYICPWFHLSDGNAAERVVDVICGATSLGSSAQKSSVAWSLASSRRRSRIGQRLQAMTANILGSQFCSVLRAIVAPARREKQLLPDVVVSQLELVADHAKSARPTVARVRHPWTQMPLASISVSPIL